MTTVQDKLKQELYTLEYEGRKLMHVPVLGHSCSGCFFNSNTICLFKGIPDCIPSHIKGIEFNAIYIEEAAVTSLESE